MMMEHSERRQWVAEVAKLNQRLNESNQPGNLEF
jgi:hypothetical protein